MAINDIFSKRQRRARGEVIDTYQYDVLNDKLRAQLLYAIHDGMGDYEQFRGWSAIKKAYSQINNVLRREYGVGALVNRPPSDFHEFTQFFTQTNDTEQALDVLELACKTIDVTARRDNITHVSRPDENADDALAEINARLKEHGVGYQYANGEIIRVDSELIHAEVVKPALRLLNGPDYAGPQEEFLSAHEQYRHGNNKEALVDCLKAFESTMKAICDKRGWERDPNATASQLIKLLFEKELIPSFWQTQINSLKSSLESAVPTGRNKLAGHGQGSEPTAVPNYLAGYMLHMTASTILFLVEAEASLA